MSRWLMCTAEATWDSLSYYSFVQTPTTRPPVHQSLIILLTPSPHHSPLITNHRASREPPYLRVPTTMKTAAAATAFMLLRLAAAVKHFSSSYPYSASFGSRIRFPTTFLATVPSHSNAAFTTANKNHQQPRRVAVIRGGAAAGVPVPASERGDGNKGSATSTATFNLSTLELRQRRGNGVRLDGPTYAL